MPVVISAGSRVTLPGGAVYDVIGDPEDYTTGPFGVPDLGKPPFTVTVRQREAGAEDRKGVPGETYGAAKVVEVYGWAPAGAREPKVAGHDQVITDLELYIPPALVVNLRRVS